MSTEPVDANTLVSHTDERGRTLTGMGADVERLQETMERHAPEPEKAPPESATPESASRGTAAGDDVSPVPVAPSRGRQRYADLTRERDEAKGETAKERTAREAVERERDELKARLATPPKTAEPESKPVAAAPVVDAKDPEPQEADFEDYPAFIRASAKWAVRQERREQAAEEAATKAKERETAAQRDFETRVSTWVGRRDTYLAARPERASAVNAFLDGVSAGTPIGDALMDSEHGAELADYLASNKAEADKIGAMSPVSAIRALGRIEAGFAAPKAPARVAAPPPPAPYQPVNGNSATSAPTSAELAMKGSSDYDKSGYRERRAAERKAGR